MCVNPSVQVLGRNSFDNSAVRCDNYISKRTFYFFMYIYPCKTEELVLFHKTLPVCAAPRRAVVQVSLTDKRRNLSDLMVNKCIYIFFQIRAA